MEPLMRKIKRKAYASLAGVAVLSLLLSLSGTASVGANPSLAPSPNSTNYSGKTVLVNGDNTACMK